MKKLLLTIVASLLFLGISFANDVPTGMTITLNPGWNVVSTPTVLSDVSFSNGGDGISFMYLEGNEWKNAVITSSNVASVFKPLEGFLVKNNNSEDVKMTLSYDMNIDIAGVMREKEVRAGWNFLGITKTSNPFEKIVSTTASIIVDFSRKFYNGASVSYMTENPNEYEIGKAYGVFADKSGIYGGLTAFLSNIDCNEPAIAAACAADSVDCPKQCQTSYDEVTGIKLQNIKLGNVRVSRGASYVLISEGNILVEKAVTIPSFSITANNTGIQSLVFIANGNEYTATTTDNLTFTFENVQIPKSGKVRFYADIDQDATLDSTILLGTISKDIISSAKYSDNNELVGEDNIAGSISFSSILVAAPRASIENTLPGTSVAFPLDDTATQTVYSGIYSVQIGDINLNRVRIYRSDNLPTNTRLNFSLFINNNKVVDFDSNNIEETFSGVLVQAGESVNIRIDAEVDAYGTSAEFPTFTLNLRGEDLVGNDAGTVSDTLAPMEIVDTSEVIVYDITGSNLVLRSSYNSQIAKFKIRPRNSSIIAPIDSISFSLDLNGESLNSNDIDFEINGRKYLADGNQGFLYQPDINVGEDGVTVEAILKEPKIGDVLLSNLAINNHNTARKIYKKYEKVLVKIASQSKVGDETVFTLEIDDGDTNATVTKVQLYTASGAVASLYAAGPVNDGEELRTTNEDKAQYITKITYTYETDENGTGDVVIEKNPYSDYFKVGNDVAKISAND